MIHSILHFIFNVTIVLMDIFQLICLINIITYDFSKFEMVQYLYKNWSYNLIKKIKIEYQSSSLYSLTNKEPLINISFPKIIQGCDCSLFNNKIYKGYCSIDLIKKNCYNIEPIDSDNLNDLYLPEINNNNEGILITIERFDNLSYLDLLLNNNTNEEFFISNNTGCYCDNINNFCIDCGVIDSLGNHFCITSYKGINNNCYKMKLEYDYSLKNNKFIHELNKTLNNINYPIEFISLFNTSTTCILQDESISSPLIDYNLISFDNITTIFNSGNKNKGCISQIFFNISTDNRWKKILNFPFEYTLSNNLKNDLKKLPLFPYEDLINKNISLSYRNFIGFDIKCFNSTLFIKNEIISYEKLLIIRILLLLFFALIFFPSLLLFFMMTSQIDILTFYQRIFFGVFFSGNILIFLESLYYELIDMNEKYENVKNIANNFCGDYLTNNLFFCLLNDFKNLQIMTKYCCYWTVIMLLACICKVVLIVTKACKKRIMFSLNTGNSNIITQVELQLLI